MEVPEFFPPPENLTAAVVHPLCEEWKGGSEVAIFHLASIFLVLGFMGGSGFYGLLYLFTFLTLGFFCTTIWSWSDACTTDTFLWNFALFGVCAVQVVLVAYRLRNVTFEKEFQDLYSYLFKKLGVSLTHFGKIVACCEGDIHTIEKDHCFAMEGKTAIDKLSVLLSGRIRVTVNGEFLHDIYPFQFLDSPEWDSLRPSEEGLFQAAKKMERQPSLCSQVSMMQMRNSMGSTSDTDDILNQIHRGGSSGSSHQKSPASKTSKTMKPIEEKIEDDVFIESEPDSPVKKRHTPTTAIEEV
uniref:Blood vessel epicardial substance n=1 Tax=Oncorhynchus mykiss TaxID=8022 RepID=A0A8C7LMK9_ONCMY